MRNYILRAAVWLLLAPILLLPEFLVRLATLPAAVVAHLFAPKSR